MSTSRKSKRLRPPSIARGVLADNVKRLRDLVFAVIDGETKRNEALAKNAHTTLSQIQRIINRDSGISIDGLEELATALGVTPRDLLTPYFRAIPEHAPEPTDTLSDTGVNRVLKAAKNR